MCNKGDSRALLREGIRRLFAHARDEMFEDGMTSKFAEELEGLVLRYGNDVLDALTALVLSDQLNSAILAEALIALGHLDDPSTLDARLQCLTYCLFRPSPAVRDAATLGLDALGDLRALPYLCLALEREPVPELRYYLKALLSEFR